MHKAMMRIKFEGPQAIGKTLMLREFDRILRKAGFKCWMDPDAMDDNTLVVDMSGGKFMELISSRCVDGDRPGALHRLIPDEA
jgi:hypothetical protein